MRVDQIALQLYTVRSLTGDDLPGTLRGVAEAGYRAVELAGLPEFPTEEIRAALDDAGLAVMGAHQAIDDLRQDLDGTLDRLETLGSPRAIVPWLSATDRSDPDAVRRVSAELGRLADACARRSIRLGYHNHDFEFAPLDGSSVWELLLASLPDSVELELDVYWASIAGMDPVDIIDRSAGRVRLLHMKDMAAGEARRDAPPGSGVLPWESIIDAGRKADVEWYVVEQDEPGDPLGDARRGFDHLRGLARSGGVSGA